MNMPKQILIADDEPNIRLMYRTALEAGGYTPTTARDGEEVLLWLQGSRPDLVLLDMRMPGIDGLEVLEAMRSSGHDIPVVIVTAHGNTSDENRAMELGAVDFVEKPLGPATLRSMVADVLARHGDDGSGLRPAHDRSDRRPGESRPDRPPHPAADVEGPPAFWSYPSLDGRTAGTVPIEKNLAVLLGIVVLSLLLAVLVQSAWKGKGRHVRPGPASPSASVVKTKL